MTEYRKRPTMLRRSSLTVPLSSRRFVERAHERGADTITLDLEDGVAPEAKAAAREGLAEAAASAGRGGTPVGVRINRPLDLAVRDLEAAIVPGVSYISIAKAESAEHVRLLSELVGTLEQRRGLEHGAIGFTAAIETPAALWRVNEIAAADARLFGIGLGSEDMASECRMAPSAEALFLPKQMVVFAARAAGIEPYGYVGTVADYTDLDGLHVAVRQARALGFAGASAIHPDQVPILNEGFAPSAEEVEHARAIVDANAVAAREGRGAFSFAGRMVDRPIVVRAEAVLAAAEAVAGRTSSRSSSQPAQGIQR